MEHVIKNLSGFEKSEKQKKEEAKQLIQLQEKSERIKKIIDMTRDIHSIPKPRVLDSNTQVNSKPNIFNRIKNYFKGLLIKYFIEPEVKKFLMHEELSREEKNQKLINEIKEKIYETNTYERERYYNNLLRTRKESGGVSGNKTPLLVDVDMINTHNQEPTEGKPSIKFLINSEHDNVKRVFLGKEKQNARIEAILKKE